MNKKVKAQITVYAALSVFLVITLICTCIRSAAVSAGRVRVEMASVLSMEAVFAGYFTVFKEKYTDRRGTKKCTAGQPDACDCGQSGFIYLYDR